MSGIPGLKDKKKITIELKEGVSIQEMTSFVRALDGHVIRTFKYLPYIAVEVSERELQALSDNDTVAGYFEDGEVFALEQQLPWGVDRIDAELVQARYGIKGYGVKVAVVDTGIDLNHPDLKVFGGNSFITSTYQDDNGHGTHVAGIIAALDNGLGVVGVAPEAQLYALKVLNSSGSGNWSSVAAALEWCIDNKMDIVSMSLGGSAADSLIQAAVTKAYQAGVLLIAAAGNSGSSDGSGDSVQYPAKLPEVIAVAATDSADKRAAFSSTGPDVEVAAPGVNILSTYLGAAYKTLNGTSMATPHVSGLAALIKCTYPDLTNEGVKNKLVQSAIDLGDPGRDPWYGYGLISAQAAVQEPGPDTKPPRIFFKSPTANETVSGVVRIELLAQDMSGVASLKLAIDGVPAAEWSVPPYIYYWDSTRVTTGRHSLIAEAVDGAGNVGQETEQFNVGTTVTLMEPKDGWVIKDDVMIKAVFSDNAVVTGAELYIDEVLKDSQNPVDNKVEFHWSSREVKLPGTSKHNVKVTAIIDGGLRTWASVNIVVRNPVIKIVQPEADGWVVSDMLNVFTYATDAGGIEKVEFYVDNVMAETVYLSPFSFDFNAKDLAMGNHALRSVAYSKDGRVAESREIIFKKPTTVSFITPYSGDVIGGRYNIIVNFTDPVSTAELYVDNIYLGNKSVQGLGPTTWFFDTIGYQNLSAVTVWVNALTVKDQVPSTARVTVTIDNYKDMAPPAVYIISPQNSYIIEQPQVEIVAGAGDDKGINYVEFYLDDTPLQKVFAPPYKIAYDFTPVAAGRHYLTVKAEDTSGNVGISDKVEIAKPTSVTMLAPADKSKVAAFVTEFKVTCSDEIIGPVKLYIDGILCQTIQLDLPTTGPATIPYAWDTTQYANSSDHTIAVEVQTLNGLIISKGIAVVTVDNSVDNTPPAVSLNSTQSGIVSGTVLFTAEASDNTGIERVEFYINGNLAEDQVFPYEYEWDSAKASTGHYSFMAKAYDPAGNTGLSNIINLAVPTIVTVISPAPDCHIIGTFNDFMAVFADPVAGSVNLYIDGEYKAAAEITDPTPGPVRVNYNWDASAYPELSQHEIMITADTARDQIVSSGMTKVYVDNRTDIKPPAVNLSASAYRVISGEKITLTAAVSDNIGISRVEFYQDGSLVTTVTEAPYIYIWETGGSPVGKYGFIAKAYDFAGNVTTGNQVFVGIATTVSITEPRDGQAVSGSVNKFTAEFVDPVGGYVYLYIDGALITGKYAGTAAASVTFDYIWDTVSYANGSSHEIKVRAYTAAGSVRSTGSIRVIVQN